MNRPAWNRDDADTCILAGLLAFLLVFALVVSWNREDAALAFVAITVLGSIAALLWAAVRFEDEP